jgi:hypothetical protein
MSHDVDGQNTKKISFLTEAEKCISNSLLNLLMFALLWRIIDESKPSRFSNLNLGVQRNPFVKQKNQPPALINKNKTSESLCMHFLSAAESEMPQLVHNHVMHKKTHCAQGHSIPSRHAESSR